ncbi:Tn3 family transposase [Streptosporangium sp. G12]
MQTPASRKGIARPDGSAGARGDRAAYPGCLPRTEDDLGAAADHKATEELINALAAALKEYGALRRTIYAARYLADPAYRRKICRQLNKGESLHALKRDLPYAHEGTIRGRHLEQQSEQAWCLTLVTNDGRRGPKHRPPAGRVVK